MIRIHKSKPFETDSIPVDQFWNVGDEDEKRMHRIHGYPAKFPAFITTKALEFAMERGFSTKRVADVFCGCGTVAYEAARNNISFWGCDINPVATLIARAKSANYQTCRLLDYYHRIELAFQNSNEVASPYESASERMKYWFDRRSYHDLAKLRVAIDNSIATGTKYHTFFLVAFSNILKHSSRWLTKSIKPQVDPLKPRANVLHAFRKQCHFAIQASADSDTLHDSDIHIVTGDFLSPDLARPKVDLIITSPPYVTSYEYADLHQLSLLWLYPRRDYRTFRNGSIGTLRANSDYAHDLKQLNAAGRKITSDLYEVDKLKARSVARYFVSMQAVAKRTRAMLSRRGLVLFVIGNTKYSGVKIDNARHLVQSLQAAGFSAVHMTKRRISKKILTPYRDTKGRFTDDGRGRKVYSEEFIIIGERS